MTEPGSNEPVSWLRLERYHLGELSSEEAREVERALAAEAATRECLEQIRRPVRLPPLSKAREAEPGASRPTIGLRSPWPLAGLAAAAALGLFVASRPAEPKRWGVPASRVHVKGGDVAIELVRDRNGSTDLHPATFRDGDRFKVLLTCPPVMDGRFDVVVVQARDVSFPLEPGSAIACGNRVPLSGAFAITGSELASVCITWGDAARDRRTVERDGIAALNGESACAALTPER